MEWVEEGLLRDAPSNILLPRTAVSHKFKCIYHHKESRYEVTFFPRETLLIVKCLECPPDSEIVRFKIAQEEAPDGNQHRILKPNYRQARR